MNRNQGDRVTITDVTLREYGQNVPAGYLHVFTPEIRVEIARCLVEAGFRDIEVFSCVSPKVAPAMKREDIVRIAEALGRIEGVNLITAVPNRVGYEHFLAMSLGPDGWDHIMGVFFSAVEAHNVVNLGRSIRETLLEYEGILTDAKARGIRVAAYVSAAFGYRPPGGTEVLRPSPSDINAHIDWYLGLGARSVTMSDLQGVADEEYTARFLGELLEERKGSDVERLGYHPHHVFGERAVANSLTAYHLGIRRFDASLGGTGGCVTGAPGNQPMEMLLDALHRKGVETGIRDDKVRALSRWVRDRLYSKIYLQAKGK